MLFRSVDHLSRTLELNVGAKALTQRHALLVLDNCEHLLECCRRVVDEAERASPEEREKLWPRLTRECDRLEALISEILVLARVDADNASAEDVDLNALLTTLQKDAQLGSPDQLVHLEAESQLRLGSDPGLAPPLGPRPRPTPRGPLQVHGALFMGSRVAEGHRRVAHAVVAGLSPTGEAAVVVAVGRPEDDPVLPHA